MRSASDMAHATQVAPLPSSWGCSAAARPPAEPAGTGRPSWSSANDIGPRFEAMTRSAFNRTGPSHTGHDPTPHLHGPPRPATMETVPDDTAPDAPCPTHRAHLGSRRPLVLLAPDAFKGTAAAPALAAAMAAGARRAGWDGDVCPALRRRRGFRRRPRRRPAPDRWSSASGAWHTTTVTGPLGEPVWPGGGWPTPWRWWSRRPPPGLPLAGGAEGNDPLRADTRGHR